MTTILLDDFWLSLQGALAERLANIVPAGAKVIYVDYPVYSNVGDLLIYLGTEHWMRQHGLLVKGRWHKDNFPFPPLAEDVVVLCQGGGNFGDLYPQQQEFREAVVRAYPNNRIVFLPQTIYYQSPVALDDTARVLRGHGDLHLFLRDRRSMEIATSRFPNCKSYLAPDMASFLYPLEESLGIDAALRPAAGTLLLLRTDCEQGVEWPVSSLHVVWRGDWKQMLGVRRTLIRLMQAAAWGLRGAMPSQAFAAVWCSVAHYVVRHCARRFQSAGDVVTSRLHGHILASLLGMPSTLLDNSYGKNSAYLDAWHRWLGTGGLRGGDG